MIEEEDLINLTQADVDLAASGKARGMLCGRVVPQRVFQEMGPVAALPPSLFEVLSEMVRWHAIDDSGREI